MMAQASFFLFVLSFLFLYNIGAARVVVRNEIPEERSDAACYPNIGCFSLDPPFTNTLWMPESPSYIGTAFFLYTRNNRHQPQTLVPERSASIQSSNFVSSVPTKILIHGFLQAATNDFLINITNALLDEASMNVIVVGWSGGARFPYGQAVANTRVVGAQTAYLVSVLASLTGLRVNNVHIIGHSLGAQVAGYAGARLPGLGRITGLDPAQPNYHGFDPEVRLDPTDANLVDVIHTDALPFDNVHGFGEIEPVGHMDFYPNGGHTQPGCRQENSYLDAMDDLFTRGLATMESDISCSHERSTTLFLASISRSCSFKAFSCSSEESFARGECSSCGNIPCPVMGYFADVYSRATGVFYLNTTASPPFCGHHQFVELTVDGSLEDNPSGSLKVKLIGTRDESEWIEVKSGELSTDVVLPKVFVSAHPLGEVITVSVSYVSDASYFSWSSRQIRLTRASIGSPLGGHKKYFCQPPNMVINSGDILRLTRGSYRENNC